MVDQRQHSNYLRRQFSLLLSLPASMQPPTEQLYRHVVAKLAKQRKTRPRTSGDVPAVPTAQGGAHTISCQCPKCAVGVYRRQ